MYWKGKNNLTLSPFDLSYYSRAITRHPPSIRTIDMNYINRKKTHSLFEANKAK